MIDEYIEARHWRNIKKEQWPSKYFTPQELACKGDGSLKINLHALETLEKARILAGKPFYINSAYRTSEYNKKIGGAPHSQHLLGKAFDISLKNHTCDNLLSVLRKAGFSGIGFYDTFIHADVGNKRTWDYRKLKGE